ncbi:uncharacterized protein LOC105798782 [Gossypium raimondii]|uniref:uncharacterized protein LOC105798782 n=1 Tax=Gossypium raimondii TaxID=29730 RepID=UPI00227BEF80|nr:uncharacterized protein LOC105798782 [Gossypium raimondii]
MQQDMSEKMRESQDDMMAKLTKLLTGGGDKGKGPMADVEEVAEKERIKEELPKQLEKRCKWLEEKFRAMEVTESCRGIDAKELSLVPDLVNIILLMLDMAFEMDVLPHIGVRYHLKEFAAEGPKNAKELFNLHHSSLRITVERVFRILKKRMGKGNKEGTSKQFRWTKPMEHVFLEILAKEARKGNKPSNTFKAVSINRVVDAISERFQVQCDAKHVENHLRTVKNQWQIICKIRGESGFGWDDNMKMITCDRATYDVAVMAHKKYEPFLNKSIDHYDEMALVVGKDMATGSFARTFADIDLDDGNEDSMPVDCGNEEAEEVRTNVYSSGTSKHKRKSVQESVVDEQIKFVGEQLGKLLMLWSNLLLIRHHSFTNK